MEKTPNFVFFQTKFLQTGNAYLNFDVKVVFQPALGDINREKWKKKAMKKFGKVEIEFFGIHCVEIFGKQKNVVGVVKKLLALGN